MSKPEFSHRLYVYLDHDLKQAIDNLAAESHSYPSAVARTLIAKGLQAISTASVYEPPSEMSEQATHQQVEMITRNQPDSRITRNQS